MVGHIQGDGRIRHICQHQHWSVMYGHFFLFYTEIRKPSFVARIHRPRALGVHTYCCLYFYIPIFLSWRNISSEEIFPKKFHGIFLSHRFLQNSPCFQGCQAIDLNILTKRPEFCYLVKNIKLSGSKWHKNYL